jgi:hypothetical protein
MEEVYTPTRLNANQTSNPPVCVLTKRDGGKTICNAAHFARVEVCPIFYLPAHTRCQLS